MSLISQEQYKGTGMLTVPSLKPYEKNHIGKPWARKEYHTCTRLTKESRQKHKHRIITSKTTLPYQHT